MEINERVLSIARNKPGMEALRDFIIDYIKEQVVVRTFAGDDARDLANARLVINSAFYNILKTVHPDNKKETVDHSE